MHKKQIEMSFIVPVYNVCDYLDDCISSLCNQGFDEGEYEVICVNDGSTDDSLSVLNLLKRKYPAVVILDQENKGVSVARNNGLMHARGTWVLFVDSDDYIDSGCIQKIVQFMKENQAESCEISYREVPEETCFSNRYNKRADLLFEKDNRKEIYSGNVWRFLLPRKEIIKHGHFFKEGLPYAEDELFLYYVFYWLNRDRHLIVKQEIYNYRIRSSSAIRTDPAIKLERHREAMHLLANEYKSCLYSRLLPKHMIKTTKSRLQYAVTNVLYDSAKLGCEPQKVLIELKDEHLYPYGFDWRLLEPHKSIRTMVSNLAKFLFSYEWYYKFFSKVITRG